MWKGIDVSDNQGMIDWAKVKAAGVQFAILRSVRGSGKADYQFAANLAGCQAQGIPAAVYKYTYATSQQTAMEEARQVVELLQSYGLRNTMVWWDVEDQATQRSLGKTVLTACIKAAQAVIEAAGYRFGIYTGLHVYNEKWFDFDRFVTIPLWMARYPSGKVVAFGAEPDEKYLPAVGRAIWGWQFSSAGNVPGINGNVDLDICYQDTSETELTGAEPGVIWCVSIADVWKEELAQAVAAAYPGCKVHKASVLDVGGIEIWIASIADVWTREQAVVAQAQFAAMGIAGTVHEIRIAE